MAVFGIEKNEYGGGKLTPVEGGSGGNISYFYLRESNNSGVNINALYKADHGDETDVVTAKELYDALNNGIVYIKHFNRSPWLFPCMIHNIYLNENDYHVSVTCIYDISDDGTVSTCTVTYRKSGK